MDCVFNCFWAPANCKDKERQMTTVEGETLFQGNIEVKGQDL